VPQRRRAVAQRIVLTSITFPKPYSVSNHLPSKYSVLEGISVPGRKPQRTDAKADATVVEAKFGDLADVYAEARREAAELMGNERAKDHWEDVADTVDGEDDR